MNTDLAEFLAERVPIATELVACGDQMRFEVAAYRCVLLPPLPYVSSVRAIVFHGESVLVQQDQHHRPVLPGRQRQVR